jgi:hypothetical protein
VLHDYQHGQVGTFYSHIVRGYEALFAFFLKVVSTFFFLELRLRSPILLPC